MMVARFISYCEPTPSHEFASSALTTMPGWARLYRSQLGAFQLKDGRERTAVAFARNDNGQVLAGLILDKATVSEIFLEIGRADIPAEMPAVSATLPAPPSLPSLHATKFATFTAA